MLRFLKKIFKIIGYVLLVLFLLAVIFLIYINFPVGRADSKAGLGVTFSHRHARDLGLDWKENFLAILDDLKIKKIRIPAYWDLVEKNPGKYDFSDLDWQLEEAGKRNAEIILAVGQKVPRWPECFVPGWATANGMSKDDRLLSFIKIIIERYKNNPTVKYWQIENEPFLNFGICPAPDADLLDSEIALARSLDPGRKIIVTDSGELSVWVPAAQRADIFGTTMYRTVYSPKVGYFDYPIGPNFFKFKKWLIEKFADQKNSIVVELQGEPWINGWVANAPLATQFESMDAAKLANNVDFAKRSGFSEVYLWGVEWWYWLKTKQNHPELWEVARDLMRENGVL